MADPGWYEDPTDNSVLRWWDGAQWTSEVSPNPAASPPMGAPMGNAPTGNDQQQGGYTFGAQQQQQQQLAPWEQQPQQQPQQQLAPWDQPASSFSSQYPDPQEQQQYSSFEDSQSPPPWPPQQQSAPWEQSAYGSGGVDPYAPQTNHNPLSGYATEEDDNVYGQSLYEIPDDDDGDGGSSLPSFLQGPKRFIFIGGATLLVLVLFMGVRSFLGGGGEEAAPSGNTEEQSESNTEGGGGVAPPDQTSEGGFPLVQLPAWSAWPNINLGYVIEYPAPPGLATANGRQVFTSQTEGTQYQLTIQSVDPAAIAALSGQERVAQAQTVILEQNPDATAEQLQNLTESSLGGLPARQIEWEKPDGSKVVARFTFTQNRIYVLTGVGPDTDRFLNSFGWFREPPTL